MAVGPLLPWRAASGELLRQRLLIPAWAGGITLVVALLLGADGIAQVLTFALAAFALASIGRTIGDRHPRPPPRPPDEALPVATRAHGARQPAAVRRARRARRRRRHRGRARGIVGLRRPSARCSSTPGAVGDGARLHGHVSRFARSSGPSRRRRVKARVRLERGGDDLGVYAPGDLDVPELHRAASARRRCAPACCRTCTSRSSRRRPQTGQVTFGSRSTRWCCGCGSAAGSWRSASPLALLPARRRSVLPTPEAADVQPMVPTLPKPPELVEAAT